MDDVTGARVAVAARGTERGAAVGTAARLARGSVLGVTWAFALLGLASASTGAGASMGGVVTGGWAALLRVLAAATAFHVAVYVWNDLVDLPLDRTEPRRATSPLVTGAVSTRAAGLVAAAAAAAALALVWSDGEAMLAMAAGLALLGAYDVWGKRASFPPLTDLVQGLGWAALVWCGAALGGAPTSVTVWLAAAVTLLILLVNGVVGAGRDLANDELHGARTTALMLGASAAGGGVRLPTALRTYGVVLHVLCIATVLGAVAAGRQAGPLRVAAVLVVGALALAALVTALARADDPTTSWAAGLGHILVMVLLPFAAVPVDGPTALVLTVLAVAPWAGSTWVRAWLAARYRARSTALLLRLRALSVLLRTGSVVAASALCLIGVRLAGGSAGGRAALGVGLVACAVAFAQVVNDLTDVEVDRLGKPHRPLPSGTVSVPTARRIAAGAAAGALAAGTALGPAFAAGAVALLALSWAYSRWWKGTVLLGNGVVALLTSTPVLVGAATHAGPSARVLAAQALVAVFMAGFEVVKTALDRDGDLAAGLRTVATVAGTRTAARIGAACCLGFALVGAFAATTSADGRAYAVVLGVGAVVPASAAAVLLLRHSRTAAGLHRPGDLRRPFVLLRLAWFPGIASLVLL